MLFQNPGELAQTSPTDGQTQAGQTNERKILGLISRIIMIYPYFPVPQTVKKKKCVPD